MYLTVNALQYVVIYVGISRDLSNSPAPWTVFRRPVLGWEIASRRATSSEASRIQWRPRLSVDSLRHLWRYLCHGGNTIHLI